jgi:hypothetical protein
VVILCVSCRPEKQKAAIDGRVARALDSGVAYQARRWTSWKVLYKRRANSAFSKNPAESGCCVIAQNLFNPNFAYR